MLYRKMPRTGDELSVLGYGCMRFPEQNGRIDERNSRRILQRAIEAGINYFDTAAPYHKGKSEAFLGQVLKECGCRDRVKIATKLPHWMAQKEQDLESLLDRQMKNLQVDRIDYYLIHALYGERWQQLKGLGIERFLERIRRDGRVAHLGFSFHGQREEFTALVNDYDWEFCLLQYNYLDESNQAGRDGLEYAASRGLGVIVMEPLRGGSLAGQAPPAVQAVWDSAPVKRTPAEWALRWIWNHPEVSTILSGMTEMEHLEENLRLAEQARPNSLNREELVLVGRAADTFRDLMRVDCTGCQYCMPCPAAVDIPGCFKLYNHAGLFNDKKEAGLHYFTLVGGLTRDTSMLASQCVECGQCLQKCPQHIDISANLRKVQAEFEGPAFRARLFLVKTYLSIVQKGAWYTLRKLLSRQSRRGRRRHR